MSEFIVQWEGLAHDFCVVAFLFLIMLSVVTVVCLALYFCVILFFEAVEDFKIFRGRRGHE